MIRTDVFKQITVISDEEILYSHTTELRSLLHTLRDLTRRIEREVTKRDLVFHENERVF